MRVEILTKSLELLAAGPPISPPLSMLSVLSYRDLKIAPQDLRVPMQILAVPSMTAEMTELPFQRTAS